MKAELYWIQSIGAGRLATMPRPRGGDWLRDEIVSLRADGVELLVSLLTPYETGELELQAEAALCGAFGIELISYPIEDMRVPPSLSETRELAARLLAALQAGRGVAAHCRAGIGRSSTIAACVLVAAGLTPEDAFARISAARGITVPDTEEQQAWVEQFAAAASGLTPGPSPFHGEGRY